MRKQQEMIQAQRKELERQRLLKRQEEEDRMRQENLQQERELSVSMTKTQIIMQKEKSNNMEDMKNAQAKYYRKAESGDDDITESKMTAGQVSKRANAVHGMGCR